MPKNKTELLSQCEKNIFTIQWTSTKILVLRCSEVKLGVQEEVYIIDEKNMKRRLREESMQPTLSRTCKVLVVTGNH